MGSLSGGLGRHRLYLLGAAALALPIGLGGVSISPVHAQPADQSVTMEELIVTARKREENIQDVPIQVTAFSAQAILDAGISTTEDFVNLVPNMTLDDSFTFLNTFLVSRGVTQINNSDAPVAIVVDGVAQNNQKQFKQNLFDVERIEVLKGPQGALYGRNAIGGAINIVTRQPTGSYEGFLGASYGNGDAIEVWGGASGPIIGDKLLFRLAGSYKHDNGRIDNTFLGEKVDFIDHDYSIRGKLTALPTDWLTLDFRAMYNDFEAGAIYDTAVFSGDPNDFQEPTFDLPGETFGDILELTFKFDADLEFATLTGITGYTDLEENYRGDLDFTNRIDVPGGFLGFLGPAGQGQNLDVELLSQELRLVSPDDQRLRWIFGAYYIHTDRELLTRGFIDLDGTPEQFDNPALVFLELSEDNDNDAWAIFGQIDVDLTDRLILTGALRYDRDRREQRDLNSGLVRIATFDAVQPKVTLSYHLDDEKLVYASYGRGFRSGGFNAPTIPIFRDETLDNLEAGFKSQWWDDRVVVNGAFYYSFVDDFQFFFVDAAAGAAQVIANIDEVEISGIELEVQARVAEGLQVAAAIGTTDTEIKANTPFPTSVGNKTPRTTEWTFNLSVQYRRPITKSLSGFARVDYEHRGDRFWQVDNADVQEPLDLLNFRVGVEGATWGLYVWGKNITDEEYFTDFGPIQFTGLTVDLGFLAQPARYGVEGLVRF